MLLSRLDTNPTRLIAFVALFLAAFAASTATSSAVKLKPGALHELKLTSPTIQPVIGRDVPVYLRSSRSVKKLRVTVGGKVITKRFVRVAGRSWKASLAVGPILRPGLNHVTAVTTDSAGRKGVGSIRIVVAKRGKPAGAVSVVREKTGHLLRVKLDDRPVVMTMRLNGKSVGGLIPRRAAGIHTVGISPDHGLKFGRNNLLVRVALKDGRYIRRNIKFNVRDDRPLAAAGRDRSASVGEVLRFNAAKTRVRGAGEKYSWRVVSRPKGSKATLSGAATKQPKLKTDVHGRYKLELRTTKGAAAGVDAVDANVLPEYPAIGARINTAAPQPGGGYALTIGENCRANEKNCPVVTEPYGDDPVMLALIDRATLAVDQVFHFDATPANAFTVLAALNVAAGSSESPSQLAVLSVLPGSGINGNLYAPALNVMTGLSPTLGTDGGFSAVGVPVADMNTNRIRTGWVNAGGAAVGNEIKGSISGLFQFDETSQNYGFATGRSSSYSTQTTDSTATQNVMRVGEQTFTSSGLESGCTGGFHIVVLRAGSLTPPTNLSENQTMSTRCADFGVSEQGVNALSTYLGEVTAQIDHGSDGPLLVFLQTLGAEAYPSVTNESMEDELIAVAGAIEKLGGNSEAFNDAIVTNGARYAIAGGTSLLSESPPNSAGQSFAPESTTLQAGSSGVLDGVLQFSKRYHFEPVSGTSKFDRTAFWSDLAYQPTKPWPFSTSFGEKNALAYISKQYNLKYSPDSSCYEPSVPDVRFEYCDLNAPWANLLQKLPGQKFSSACKCTPEEWKNVTTQIVTEVNWVNRVYKYVGIVQSIYGTSSAPAALGISSIGSSVENAVNPPSTGDVFGTWSGMTGDILNLLSVVPGAGELGALAGMVSGLAFVFQDAISDADGAQTLGEMVNTTAAELPAETARRYQSASEQFGQLGDVIVTDYGKLSKAATSTQIQIDETTISKSIGELMAGSYSFAYKRLLPIGYNAYGLPFSGLSPTANTPQQYLCNWGGGIKFEPFKFSGPGTWIPLSSDNPRLAIYGNDRPVMLALGEKYPESRGSHVQVPPSSLVNPLTQPVTFDDQGTPQTFGQYLPWLLRHNFAQRTFYCAQ